MFKQISFLAILMIGATAGGAAPLEKPVVGPKLICFKYSTFFLREGERVTDLSGSPEGISIKVESPSGGIEISESEIFAPAKAAQSIVASSNKTSVYRVPSRGGRYAIYGPTSFSDGNDRLVILLSGAGLIGNRNDASVYGRFQVRDTAGLRCEHTFTYSWEF
jgi:hypothetical protein